MSRSFSDAVLPELRALVLDKLKQPRFQAAPVGAHHQAQRGSRFAFAVTRVDDD